MRREFEGKNGIVERLEGNVGMARSLQNRGIRRFHCFAFPPFGIPEIGQNSKQSAVSDRFDSNSLDIHVPAGMDGPGAGILDDKRGYELDGREPRGIREDRPGFGGTKRIRSAASR